MCQCKQPLDDHDDYYCTKKQMICHQCDDIIRFFEDGEDEECFYYCAPCREQNDKHDYSRDE